PFPVWVEILERCGKDKLIPAIVWQNLHPLLEDRSRPFLDLLLTTRLGSNPALTMMIPRIFDRLLAGKADAGALAGLLGALAAADLSEGRQCLAALTARVQTGELAGAPLAPLPEALLPRLRPPPAAPPP